MDPVRSDVSTLVVADSESVVALGERLPTADGRIAATTVSPSEALPAVREEAPDCVVLEFDPATPVGGLLADLHGSFPDIPVFAVVEDADGGAALDDGATDYVRADGERVDRVLADRIVNALARRRVERTDEGDARDRYRQLLGSSPFPVTVVDGDGEILFGNPAADDLLAGGDPGGLVGRSLSELVHPEDWPTVEESVEAAVHHGTVVPETETRIDCQDADGETIHAKVALAPGIYHGEPAAQVVVSDVTDYKRFNEDLRRLYAIASDPEADFEEKVDRALELGSERFGLNVGFLSTTDHAFEVVAARGDHPKIQRGSEAPLSKTYCRKAIESEDTLTVENAPEEGWVDDPAYEEYGLSCYVGAKVHVEGELYGTLCFADGERTRSFSDADVTLVDLMARWIGYEIERERHLRELRTQNERFEELATTLSHDMGNLLEVARGHVEYALKTGETDRLGEAEDAHDRAVNLLRHMVTLTRAGQRIDERTPVDLRTVAADAWTHVDRDGDGLTLDLSGDERVLADRDRLLQLLENLFRNSVDHGSTGSQAGPDDSVEHGSTGSRDPGGAVSVRVGRFDDGFFVEDDGEGIPPQERERIFESGFSGSADGTGLGLSIVEQIAGAHGWSVRATEASDGGARFEVAGVTFVDASE